MSTKIKGSLEITRAKEASSGEYLKLEKALNYGRWYGVVDTPNGIVWVNSHYRRFTLGKARRRVIQATRLTFIYRRKRYVQIIQKFYGRRYLGILAGRLTRAVIYELHEDDHGKRRT